MNSFRAKALDEVFPEILKEYSENAGVDVRLNVEWKSFDLENAFEKENYIRIGENGFKIIVTAPL